MRIYASCNLDTDLRVAAARTGDDFESTGQTKTLIIFLGDCEISKEAR